MIAATALVVASSDARMYHRTRASIEVSGKALLVVAGWALMSG